MSQITLENLQAQKARYTAQREQLVNNANALSGAILAIDELIKQVSKPDPTSQPQPSTPPSP